MSSDMISSEVPSWIAGFSLSAALFIGCPLLSAIAIPSLHRDGHPSDTDPDNLITSLAALRMSSRERESIIQHKVRLPITLKPRSDCCCLHRQCRASSQGADVRSRMKLRYSPPSSHLIAPEEGVSVFLSCATPNYYILTAWFILCVGGSNYNPLPYQSLSVKAEVTKQLFGIRLQSSNGETNGRRNRARLWSR